MNIKKGEKVLKRKVNTPLFVSCITAFIFTLIIFENTENMSFVLMFISASLIFIYFLKKELRKRYFWKVLQQQQEPFLFYKKHLYTKGDSLDIMYHDTLKKEQKEFLKKYNQVKNKLAFEDPSVSDNLIIYARKSPLIFATIFFSFLLIPLLIYQEIYFGIFSFLNLIIIIYLVIKRKKSYMKMTTKELQVHNTHLIAWDDIYELKIGEKGNGRNFQSYLNVTLLNGDAETINISKYSISPYELGWIVNVYKGKSKLKKAI
ncbi:hypothetical protein [Flammeovirga aprica]|uniref:Uncharacterized protein n=1 Tax=Flammeovirga aprica JL-4 TaxID=694437 RepID=A0A7X9XB28_9BACT|nr:hypothetical protein [Flammeovirga aprica]NME70229.1 hypothetical protein [Flammeovirga aprica JL-4]